MRKLQLDLELLDVQTFATNHGVDSPPESFVAHLASSSPCLNSEVTCNPVVCVLH